MPPTLLAKAYPTADDWRTLVETFTPEAIAYKLLLSHIPFVFKDEPAKFALFRRAIAKEFDVEATNVFIVGSAMSGRSLKGKDIEKSYSAKSDIDALIVSEHMFTTFLMESLEWVKGVAKQKKNGDKYEWPKIENTDIEHLYNLSNNACKGIWRPDSLPEGCPARTRFFDRFRHASLTTLALQLSEDTVSKVTGRVARSFEEAIDDLAQSIRRLRKEFRNLKAEAQPNNQSGQ